jgi:hypothetical protein
VGSWTSTRTGTEVGRRVETETGAEMEAGALAKRGGLGWKRIRRKEKSGDGKDGVGNSE